jgi:hypothetical protein
VVATYDIRPQNEAFESTSPRLSLLLNQTVNFVARMYQLANTTVVVYVSDNHASCRQTEQRYGIESHLRLFILHERG